MSVDIIYLSQDDVIALNETDMGQAVEEHGCRSGHSRSASRALTPNRY